MSNINRGKQFEDVIRKAFEKVPNTNVERMADPVQGYLGVRNHSDFIVYHKPYEYHIECKSVHGNTLPFSNITKNQWDGLLEVGKVDGIIAGIICWWVNKDVTRFIPIQMLEILKTELNAKSIRFDFLHSDVVHIHGKKKRVFFDYDMEDFFQQIEKHSRRNNI